MTQVTGCSSPATASRARPRRSATTSRHFPTSRPRSARRRDRSRRVGFPGALRRPRHPHGRRPPGRARGDEPRSAEDEPARRAQGRDHRQHGRVQRPHPAEGGIRGQPARGWDARRLPRPRGGAHVHDRGGSEGDRGGHVAGGGALEELLRAGADVVALPPPHRGDDRLHLLEVREAPRDRRGQHAGVPRGLELRRDVRGLCRLVRGRAGPARTGDVPPDHGHTALSYGLIAASRLSGLPLFLGAYPITPASSILEARGTQGVRGRHVPGRGSRPSARPWARPSAARSASAAGPGSPQGRDGRPRDRARAAIGGLDIQRAGPSTGCRPSPSRPIC